MTDSEQPRHPALISQYHAHVYFATEAEQERAAWLREQVAQRFPGVRIGSWHDRPVGPHSQPMYQLAFAADQLALVLPWLMVSRNGLSILLHPETGNGYADHTEHAAWLGPQLPLRLAAFRRA